MISDYVQSRCTLAKDANLTVCSELVNGVSDYVQLRGTLVEDADLTVSLKHLL